MSKNYVNIALFEFSIKHIRQHTEKLESKSKLIIVCDYMRYRLNTNYNMSSINQHILRSASFQFPIMYLSSSSQYLLLAKKNFKFKKRYNF